jgi:hypothetical protein
MVAWAFKPTVQVQSDGATTALMDSASGRSMPLTPDEAFVLEQFDGSRTPRQLAIEAKAQGRAIETETISRLFERLFMEGFLEKPPDETRGEVMQPLRMDEAVPQFRGDLKVARKGESKGLYEVTNPTSGKTFTLYDFEVSIARMLDGRRKVSDVVEAAGRIGIPITLSSFQQFVRQLKAYGFVAANSEAAPQPGRVAGSAWAPRAQWTDEVRHLVQGALKMFRMGRIQETRDYLTALLQVDPGNAEALEMMTRADEAARAGEAIDVSFDELHAPDDAPDELPPLPGLPASATGAKPPVASASSKEIPQRVIIGRMRLVSAPAGTKAASPPPPALVAPSLPAASLTAAPAATPLPSAPTAPPPPKSPLLATPAAAPLPSAPAAPPPTSPLFSAPAPAPFSPAASLFGPPPAALPSFAKPTPHEASRNDRGSAGDKPPPYESQEPVGRGLVPHRDIATGLQPDEESFSNNPFDRYSSESHEEDAKPSEDDVPSVEANTIEWIDDPPEPAEPSAAEDALPPGIGKAAAPAETTDELPESALPKPPPKPRRAGRKVAGALGFLGLASAAALLIPLPNETRLPCQLHPKSEVAVLAQTALVIKELVAQDNAWVEPGAVLVTLETGDDQQRVESLAGEVPALEAKVATLEAKASKVKVQKAAAAVDRAEHEAEAAEKVVKALEAAGKKTSRPKLARAKAVFEKKALLLSKARASLAKTALTDELSAANGTLTAKRQELAAARAAMPEGSVVAPAAGKLVFTSGTAAGKKCSAGDELGKLQDPRTLETGVELALADAELLRAGRPVSIVVEGRKLQARGRQKDATKGAQTVHVDFDVEDPEKTLGPSPRCELQFDGVPVTGFSWAQRRLASK